MDVVELPGPPVGLDADAPQVPGGVRERPRFEEGEGRLDRGVPVLTAGVDLVVGVVDRPGGAEIPGQPLRMRHPAEGDGLDVVQARREPGDADLGPVDGPDPGRGTDARPDVAHERALDRVVERSGRHEGRGGGDGRRRRVGRVPAKGRHRRRRPDGGQRSVRMERKVGALEGPRYPRDRLVADEEGTEHRLERAPRRLALREHGREAVEPPVAERQAIAAVELAPVGGAPVCERRGVAVEAPPAPVEEGGLRGAGGTGDPLGKGAELRLLPRGDDGGEVVGEEPRNLASAGFGNVPPSEGGRPPRKLGQSRRDGLSLPATIAGPPLVADRNGHSRNVSLNGSMVSNRARRFSVTSAPSERIRAPRS